jgi:uncharacterized membrane protein YeaQ/YmgE (transglycosylase-associated protein family)
MGIVSWILLGLVAGFLAGQVMKGSGYGVVGDVVMGVIGAVVGGWLSSYALGVDVNGFNVTSVLIAFVGAVVVIAVYRMATRGRVAA